MRILGVDPGTWRMGAGIIQTEGNRYKLVHFEVIRMSRNLEISQRLHKIYHSLNEIIRIYEPEVLALEDIFYAQDVRAMVRIGEARACAMLAASERKVKVVEYTPTRIKQAVSGNGRATKEQIRHMIQRLLSLDELPPSDGADALAAAVCHVHAGGQGAKQELLDQIKKASKRKKRAFSIPKSKT